MAWWKIHHVKLGRHIQTRRMLNKKVKVENHMIKYQHKKERAWQITVNIEGNVQEYAMSLLHIINNARVNPNTIYKVENSSSNYVYVTCDKGDRDAVREYLENFGEIVYEEDIN